MAIDINKLTLGEIAKIEDLSGASINTLGEDETPKGKMLAALVFVTKRREGFPSYTWNEALGLSIDEANEILGFGDDDEDDPSDAGEGNDADPFEFVAPENSPTELD